MKNERSGISTIAGYAVHEFRQAEKLEKRDASDPLDAFRKAREAERARADGERLLKLHHPVVGDASTEIVPVPEPDAKVPAVRRSWVSTLAEPNTISVDASEHRTSVATRAGVLSPALDAAVSARAKNSIEKMLSHQMAAAHFTGMELIVKLEESPSLHQFPPVEIARLANAAARMFEVYQSACLTLLKLKAKGRQTVIVQHQHVNVGNGGQAVVGQVGRGSRSRRGRKRANGR
jgi:hypothetical protein